MDRFGHKTVHGHRWTLGPVCLFLITVVFPACDAWRPVKGDMEVIGHVLGRLTQAFEDEDIDMMSGLFHRGRPLVVFGPRARDFYEEWGSLKTALEEAFRLLDKTEITVVSRSVSLRRGDTALFSELLSVAGTCGAVPFSAGNARLSGVLEKHGGVWVTVHLHLSLPSPGGEGENGTAVYKSGK